MRRYLCVCADPCDRDAAQRIGADLTRYGFRVLTIPDGTSRREREDRLTGCRCAVAVTSPEAETGSVGADIRLLLASGIPVMCVSLADNALDRRLCVPFDPDGEPPLYAAELLPCPAASEPDTVQAADAAHRLLVRRLCRYTDCFSPDDCASDATGHAARLAAAAWDGDSAAAFALAGLYESGTGLPRLASEAVRWMETAAGRGHRDAMLRLAAYRLDGFGGVCDPGEALSLCRRIDDARGLYGQGLCAEFGFGMLSDPGEAARLYRLAIERAGGVYPEAQLRLGLIEAQKARSGQPGAFRRAAMELCRAAQYGSDTEMPLFLRRPVSRQTAGQTGQRPAFRLVSLRSMAEKVLIPMLNSRGVYPSDSRGVMRVCRCRRRVYPEAAWLPIPVSGDADAADIDLYGHFAAMRFDASMPAYALGLLLEDAHRLSLPETAAGRACRVSGADALRWYRFAASRGHSAAMRRLGDCYREGFGVPRDPEQAVRLYEKAAELGDNDGRFLLGVCLEAGEGVGQNGEAAVRMYEQAAAEGYAPAMNNLGGCCERGFGVLRDQSAAVDWYERAAALGQPEAAYRLGRCAESGLGIPRDTDRAARLYRQAASAGNPYAVYRLGLFADHELTKEPGTTRSTRLYECAARAGVPEAAYAMGLCARSGRGVCREADSAFRWFCIGADKEGRHIQSVFETAACLFDGLGTIRDRREAVRLFGRTIELWEARRASPAFGIMDDPDGGLLPPDGMTADEATAEAMFRLGYCTLYGIGTDGADVTAAAAWLSRAAELGHAGACALMGDLYAWGYLHGEGTVRPEPESGEMPPLCAPADLYPNPWGKTAPGDHAEAVKWYRRAIGDGQMAGRTCREGRANALMSLALDSSVKADRLYAAGKLKIAHAADTACFDFLKRAADMDESRDEALLLEAAAVFGGRGGQSDKPGAAGDIQAAAAYLKGIRRESPAYAAAEMASGDFILYTQQTSAGMTLNASPYVQTAAHYLRALNKYHAVGADSSLSKLLTAETEESGEAARSAGAREPTETVFCLRERAVCRRAMTEQVRREALYRMAILCASHLRTERIPEPTSDRAKLGHRVCFAYLVQAILCGHKQAEDDLARMLAYPASAGDQTAQRRLHLFGAAGIGGDASAVPEPSVLMRDYYAADRRLTVPFNFGTVCRPDLVPDDPFAPDDPSKEEVTPAMRASAMNYLGDCLYYGQFLPMDKAAAVTCFRQAADANVPDCPAVTWAQYSLGCCLVSGTGTEADPRAGVGYLTVAAKTHGAAAYTLASCYENGVGVDPGDYRYREAVKYYRRARTLGYKPAEEKLKNMET